MSSRQFKVSVIVPMYNVERYLQKCVDSLLAQTLKDIEIILVDDGSPDKCGAIADKYAATFENVKSYHRANGGLGPARNTGIEIAQGDYIGFVDSDDWVHPWMFERLYQAAIRSHADIAVGGFEEWTDGKLKNIKGHPFAGKVLTSVDEISLPRMLLYGRDANDKATTPYPVAVWTSIYRRSLFDERAVRFHDVLSEDVFFNLDIYRHAHRIAFIDSCGYCYRKDCQASITRTFSPEKADRYACFFSLLAQYALREDDSESCLRRACRKMVDYARSYVFMVEKSSFSINEKVKAVNSLTSKVEFKRYCADYPANSLPSVQALFHRLLVGGHERTALMLTRLRMIVRGEK